MAKVKSLTLAMLLVLISSTINTVPTAAADCPDFTQFEKSSSTLVPYSYSDFQKDLPAASYPDDLRYTGYQIEIGDPFFRKLNMYPMYDPELLKIISEKGENIAVYYYAARSSDGVNWKRLSRAHWDFMDDTEKELLPSNFNPNGPVQSVATSISRPQLISGISLLRQGLTPGMKQAIALEISIKGCPTKTIYTKRFTVPKFEIRNQSVETYIANEQKFTQRDPMNFLQQEDCAKSLESIVSAAKSASTKSLNWSMPQIPTGVLGLNWKNGGQSLCTASGDVTIQPSFGDQCLKRLNPGQSAYSYTTLKFPCTVSVDIRGSTNVQLATFTINKPNDGSPQKNKISTVTCSNGKTLKKVSGLNPRCPSGYKKM